MCAQQTFFSTIFFLNKITASSPESFYFLGLTSKKEDAMGMRLDKVWTERKKVGMMHVLK